MTEPHIVSVLRRKRAEIGGYVRDLERQLERQREALAHVDATIRLFAPGVNPDAIPPKRHYRRTRYFAKGELSRLCLEAIRKANGAPITTGEIAKAVITGKGLPIGPDSITEMVLVVLRRYCKSGTVVKHGTSRNAKWFIG